MSPAKKKSKRKNAAADALLKSVAGQLPSHGSRGKGGKRGGDEAPAPGSPALAKANTEKISAVLNAPDIDSADIIEERLRRQGHKPTRSMTLKCALRFLSRGTDDDLREVIEEIKAEDKRRRPS